MRAYCEKNREYRNSVLSRLRGAPELMDGETENGIPDADQWNSIVNTIIKPDERLTLMQKAIIEEDFGMVDGRLQILCRQALVKYGCSAIRLIPKRLTRNLRRN